MYLFATCSSFGFRTKILAELLLLVGVISACIRTPVGRDVSVVSARWNPDQAPLTIVDNLDLLRDEEENTLLRDPALRGKITVTSYSSTGLGTRSRIVLILQKPVQERIYLPVPDGVTVTYIQEADGWKMIPNDAPMLDDVRLRLETRNEDKVYATEATLELPGGGGELLGGVGWTEE